MDFIDKKIQAYAEMHTGSEPSHLYELNRYTHMNVLQPRMLSGHLQGRFLSMMSSLISPLNILDIGTYTGYSALCLAEGLRAGGKVYTLEANEEYAEIAEAHIKSSPYADEVIVCRGNALEMIKALNGQVPEWDIVWIDAEKGEYDAYYELCIDKVRKGGLLMADNVLWSGRVVNEVDLMKDKDTKAIHDFNVKRNADPRVRNMLLPVRDGIMMMQKV
jgi:caffeoyl-CoA O-methyltransferase